MRRQFLQPSRSGGLVDADDYFLIDSEFAQGIAYKGDIDLNGFTDADDYFLIDSAFAQGCSNRALPKRKLGAKAKKKLVAINPKNSKK